MSKTWLNIKFFLGILLFGWVFFYLCYKGYSYVQQYVKNESRLVEARKQSQDEMDEAWQENLQRQRELEETRKELARVQKKLKGDDDIFSDHSPFIGGEIIAEPVEEDEPEEPEGEKPDEAVTGQVGVGEETPKTPETPEPPTGEEKIEEPAQAALPQVQPKPEVKPMPVLPIVRQSKAKPRLKVPKELPKAMAFFKAKKGDPVFIRIIKEKKLLELWMQPRGKGEYVIVKTYPILGMSGNLGPKTKQGDKQAPEGFYHSYASSLNPNSNYHLSFNVGYPNLWDKAQNRTGAYIMVHGKDVSIGCFAMGDPAIEEIYELVEASVKGRYSSKGVPVQVYPFEPTTKRMLKEINNKNYPFWMFLAEAWYWTEENQAPAPVVLNGMEMVLDDIILRADEAGMHTYMNKKYSVVLTAGS